MYRPARAILGASVPLDLLASWSKNAGIPLDASQISQFAQFEEALYDWNQKMNLTRVPREECEERHFIDSLLIAPFIPQGATVLDIGTGAGFPSWPLACARPDLRVTALDGSEKTFAFLSAVPLPNLKLRKQRAEDEPQREFYDFVTGRALAPVAVQIEASSAWVRVGGLLAPFRTPAEEEEAARFPARLLGLELQGFERCELPSGALRLFPLYRKAFKTPRSYPRQWAAMKSSPLGRSEPSET